MLALIPLEWLVYKGDQIREALMPDLEERLKSVPPERIQTPAPEVAGPLFEALRFTAHDNDLRRMYANLLGTAIDISTAHTAHPSFVEILKQLSPDEARIIQTLAKINARYYPTVSVRDGYEIEGRPYLTETVEIFNLFAESAGCVRADLVTTYIRNLIRLGLLEPIQGTVSREDLYEQIESHPTISQARAEIEKQEGHSVTMQRSCLGVTVLGRQFIDACADVKS